MSNAFEKSKMITSTCFFWSMLHFNSSVVIMSCDTHGCCVSEAVLAVL